MPRIDPLSLLKCLSLLLSPDGGINSREEVPRFVNLMTKFSKRLVSKCVYLLILKSTDVSLLDMFMTSGGWLLIQTWLQEAMSNSNWDLVQEVLELLLMTPVDSTRLRLNNIPKLVKTLSKREDLGDVKEMATSLVNNWLAIVKNSTINQEEKLSETSPEACNNAVDEVKKENVTEVPASEPPIKSPVVTNEIETIELQEPPIEEPVKMEVEDENTISTSMFYKITIRDGKQVLTKLVNAEEADEKSVTDLTETPEDTDIKNIEQKSEDGNKVEIKKESKSKSSSKSSSSSSRKDSSSSKSSSSSKDKKHSSKHSSRSSSSSSRDKSKKENEKDKHRSNGSTKHSSSNNEKSKSSSSSSSRSKDKKESKEKQAEKDKDTLEKVKPVTLDKIGRIPKKPSSDEKEVKKKPTMSIEPKKKGEDRPKTVKIFNSKMRSTGLEEEVKPPPPRSAIKKPPPVIPPITLPSKRSSPPKEPLPAPPEKKIKLDIPERIGAIKLIPPKPKPAFLQESDIFMDALTAASSKKEPKKKKRRLSQSKESEETVSPVQQATPTATPIGIKNYSPANFYQETLNNTSENETAKEDKTDEPMEEGTSEETTKEVTSEVMEGKTECADIAEGDEPSTRTNSDGLKGALVYFKKKGPKRSLRWRDDKDLVEIRYFELDETERVNVSRPNFTELAKLDMTHEREALLGRKLNNEDLMEPTTMWRVPYIVDQPDLPVQPGSKSLEKDIQYARSKNTLQALYFNKNTIPDTPGEPIPEIHPMVDPVSIPLEDAESQICDLRNTPWPEPKGLAPVEQAPVNIPPMFQNIPGPFPNFPQMGPPGFPGMQGPRFGPPTMMPNGPPNMMPNNINMMGNPTMNMGPPIDMINQVPMNQVPMNQGPMNPNMFGPNMDSFNPMMNENQNYPIPFNQQNMYGPPNNNFNNMERGGGHRGRGAFRRGHNNWNRNVPRGGSSWRGNGDHRGGRICKNVKNHGYCRKIDTCPFIHPN